MSLLLFRASSGLLSRRCRPNTEVTARSPCGRRGVLAPKREKAKKIAALRAEISKNAPPIDFKAPLDSLEIMEGIMRHFHQRALIEQRMGPQADWSVVDALMLKTLAAAEKVARYRHAQLSAVRLAGDISGKMDDVSLDELLVTIKQEWAKLGPLIGLDPNQLLLLQGAENRSPVTVNGSEPEASSPLRRRSPGMSDSSA
jgi:hypothetical protein